MFNCCEQKNIFLSYFYVKLHILYDVLRSYTAEIKNCIADYCVKCNAVYVWIPSF